MVPDVSSDLLIDIQKGKLNQTAIDLVARTARAVARTGRYTTPSGGRQWSGHDVDDLVADFLGSEGRLIDLAINAQDISHLKSQIEKSMVRLIIDRLRAGPVGILRRRIERRLRGRQDVVAVAPRHWSLEKFAGEPHWGGADGVLAAAAAQTPVDAPPAWPEDSPRSAPATTTRSVDAVCTAVLEVAASPVHRPVVLTTVSQRIVPVDPRHVYEAPTDAAGAVERSPEEIVMAAYDREAASAVADAVWKQLDADERALVPFLNTPSRQVEEQGVLPLGKSAIDSRQKKLRSSLAAVLENVPDLGLVAAELLLRYSAWAEGTGRNPGVEP